MLARLPDAPAGTWRRARSSSCPRPCPTGGATASTATAWNTRWASTAAAPDALRQPPRAGCWANRRAALSGDVPDDERRARARRPAGPGATWRPPRRLPWLARYARERRQSRAPGSTGGPDFIAQHRPSAPHPARPARPGRRRRVLAYCHRPAAGLRQHVTASAAERQRPQTLLAVLTPVVKALPDPPGPPGADPRLGARRLRLYARRASSKHVRDSRIAAIAMRAKGLPTRSRPSTCWC